MDKECEITVSHAYMSWLEATRQADERNKTNFIE